MKKTIGLLVLLMTVVTGLFFLENEKSKVVLVDGEKAPVSVRVHYDMGELVLHPWYDGKSGIWYVFFPSYIDTNVIDCSELTHGNLYVNGEKKEHHFEWQDNMLYELVYHEDTMQVIFLADENLSTLFIETESGSNDLIREAKENVEEGYMISLDRRGNLEYSGKVKEISGHGNAWEFYDKRAYDIKLGSKASLAGIEGGNHFKLLHLWNDGDKIHSKLAFDVAEILGAEYTPQCTWVNVYLNGEYHGMYLLATAVRDQDVFRSENVVFLEKDIRGRYEAEEHVVSEAGNAFVIHRPKEVGEKKKEEIAEMVQKVEDSIAEGALDEALVDVDSFATQFLVDEIALNSDGFETSTYLYRLAGSSVLCAGPAWDYDGAFGEYLHLGENNVDPKGSALDGEHTELTWYQSLYENPEFLEVVAAKYQAVMPQLEELYEETIDIYTEYIKGSVRNDAIRWSGYSETLPRTGTYQTWENNVRYLKYFCMNRYNALKERWNIAGDELTFEGNDEQHKVKLLYSGSEEEITVADGATLDISQFDDAYYQGRSVARIAYSEEVYSEYLPVLEDMTIKVETDVRIWEAEGYKYVDISKDMFAENYDYVSIFIIGSDGSTQNVQVAEPLMEDIHLEFAKEETGTVAIYAVEDETGAVVLEEILIEY